MPGACYVAIKAEVDIVPMAIVGTFEALPMNSYHIRPGTIELLVGDPIPTAGCTLHDADKLSERVQKAVEDLYYARAKVADPRIVGENVNR
jgi:1-acyl-sn-glycerol-3-phosphate acyltransferase